MSDFLNTSGLNCLYFGMLVGGLVLALGTLLLSGGGADADADADIGDVDVDGIGDMRIFSPVTMAAFMAVFGAVGLVASIGFGVKPLTGLLIAAVSAAVVSVAVAAAYGRLLVALHGSTNIRSADMVGVEAMVTTPIPADGMGEVMFVMSDERLSRPARSATGEALSRGASVFITQVTGVHVLVSQQQPIDEALPPEPD